MEENRISQKIDGNVTTDKSVAENPSNENDGASGTACIEKNAPSERDVMFMRLALEELKNCPEAEVPVAAIIVLGDEIVGRGVNRRETDGDPTAHAEIIAIRDAAKKLGRWNLTDCELFVTLEPCAMCAGAVVYSRISRVVFGAYDVRFGACGSALDVAACERLNHRANIVGGVLQELCLPPIQNFFREARKNGGRKNKSE